MAAEDIDRCMTLGAGMPMGPLALLDFVGLDVAQAIGESIGAPVPEQLRELVAPRARSAASPAQGFYRTTEGGLAGPLRYEAQTNSLRLVHVRSRILPSRRTS